MTGKDVTAYDPARLAKDEARVDRGFWKKLRRTLGIIPFAEEVLSAFYCARDPVTPTYVKAVLMAAIGYFIVPTDMIPDFIAAFGFTDDAAVLAAALAAVSRHIKPRHNASARAFLEKEAPEAKPEADDK